MVNQFIVTVYEGEVFLSVGTLTPPAISGPTTEDVKRQVDTIGYVPVRTAVKLGLTPRRLRELVRVLERGVEIYEQQQGADE